MLWVKNSYNCCCYMILNGKWRIHVNCDLERRLGVSYTVFLLNQEALLKVMVLSTVDHISLL